MSTPHRTQEQRRETTRAAVLEAARERLLTQGFAKTSIDQIAQDAGYSRRVVYDYFGSKESLYLEVSLDGLEVFLALVRDVSARATTDDQLIALTLEMLGDIHVTRVSRGDLHAIQAQAMSRPELAEQLHRLNEGGLQLFEHIVEALIRVRKSRTKASTRRLAMALGGAVEYVDMRVLDDPSYDAKTELVAFIDEVLLPR